MRRLSVALAFCVAASAAQAQQTEEVRDTYGAWQIKCAPNTDRCVMNQTGKGANGNDVIDIRIRKLPEGTKDQNGKAIPAAIQIAAPLGVMLQAGVRLQVDDKPPRGAAFEVCAPVGCVSRQPLGEDFLDQLKDGTKAVITVIAAPNNTVTTEISLSGFTKAYRSLKP